MKRRAKREGGRKVPRVKFEKESLSRGDGRRFVFYWFKKPSRRGG